MRRWQTQRPVAARAAELGVELVVTVITRGEDIGQQTPGGFRYVDEMFTEAGLSDSVSDTQPARFWERLRVVQRALGREFGGRVAMCVLNPWTPRGLWFIVRYRVREFPCLVIAGRSYPLEMSLNDLIEAVHQGLR